MIPVVNLLVLIKMLRLVGREVETETEKAELNQVRAESKVCQTRYPLLMVHGVFFRDFKYLNYWGRIPKELQRNGAVIYYGGQQSAASVADAAGDRGKDKADLSGDRGGKGQCDRTFQGRP